MNFRLMWMLSIFGKLGNLKDVPQVPRLVWNLSITSQCVVNEIVLLLEVQIPARSSFKLLTLTNRIFLVFLMHQLKVQPLGAGYLSTHYNKVFFPVICSLCQVLMFCLLRTFSVAALSSSDSNSVEDSTPWRPKLLLSMNWWKDGCFGCF